MLNYQMSQNLKLLRYGKFNHLINTSNKEIALSGFKILTLNAMKEKGKLNWYSCHKIVHQNIYIYIYIYYKMKIFEILSF